MSRQPLSWRTLHLPAGSSRSGHPDQLPPGSRAPSRAARPAGFLPFAVYPRRCCARSPRSPWRSLRYRARLGGTGVSRESRSCGGPRPPAASRSARPCDRKRSAGIWRDGARPLGQGLRAPHRPPTPGVAPRRAMLPAPIRSLFGSPRVASVLRVPVRGDRVFAHTGRPRPDDGPLGYVATSLSARMKTRLKVGGYRGPRNTAGGTMGPREPPSLGTDSPRRC